MRAVLVAAGLGTRLAPLTDLLPKPAVPVANRPVAAYLMEHLVACGIRELVANAFHLPDQLEAALLAHVPAGAQLSLVREKELLGTGGGVKNALTPQADEDFLVANAKLLFAPNVAAAVARHRESGALATMVLKPMPEGSRFGAIDVDSEGRVRRMLDSSPRPEPGLRRCMFTGVQILGAEAHGRLPDKGCAIREGYMHWLAEGEHIASVLDDSSFVDVGQSLAVYHAANMDLCSGVLAWPGVQPSADGNLVHPLAQLGQGARVVACVVGEGAHIAAGVHMERALVWPGSHVNADVRDCIVTPQGVVDRTVIFSSRPSSGTRRP